MTVYLGDGEDDPASGLVTSDLTTRPGSWQCVVGGGVCVGQRH